MLITSVDARPWEIDRVPLTEFSMFTDALAPQVYWSAFSTPPNIAKFLRWGENPGLGGMTPRFALDSAVRNLARFNRPVYPVGDGTVADDDAWREFIDGSFEHNAEAVSVWRYGVTDPGVWRLLQELPPRPLSYAVQPGDTLGAIASRMGTDIDSLVAANGITDPHLLAVGQQLRLPRGVRPPASPARQAVADAGLGESSGRGTYSVRPGDSLWGLARRWGTTPEAIAQFNGIADASLIQIGMPLRIP
jgi:LysM repeat protein